MNIKTLTISVLTASLLTTIAFAHEGATGIVKERMDAMSVMGKNMKLLVPIMQGKSAYDAEIVKKAAQAISSLSGKEITKLFPKMDMEMPNNVSKAKPMVWQDWDKFSTISDELLLLTKGLELAADNGLSKSEKTQDNSSLMGGSSSSMMGGGTKTDATPTLEELAKMPANDVFKLVSNSCSSCHTQFRKD